MKTVFLLRIATSDAGTIGDLAVDDFRCVTLELPWKNNKPDISCIPANEYICRWTLRPKHGWVYQVTNVPNRADILLHCGNFEKDTEGCILLGKDSLTVDGQKEIDYSKDTVDAFNSLMAKDQFRLSITETY